VHDGPVPASELEQLSPDQRARVVAEHSTEGVADLDPAFRARVEAKGRQLLEERGLLDPEHQ
jgi:hypothetical protein